MRARRPRVVSVRLGDRGYDVEIGPGMARDPLVAWLRRAYGSTWRERVQVVVDARVRALHEDLPWRQLSAHPPILLRAGERAKTVAGAERLWRQLARRGLGRDAAIVAIGGGVVGDLAGFVAATYQRGIDVVQVPSTLLAQVDASVGGKTAVNVSEGKNLVGAFHQPRHVAVDSDLLATLPRRQWRAGLAEVLKMALVAGGAAFDDVIASGHRLAESGTADALRLVPRAIEAKARIVEADERESGVRRHLNLGHTLGHALEAASGYRSLLHGEAVALGLLFAVRLSVLRCGLDPALAIRIGEAAAPLAPTIPAALLRFERLVPFLARDKKAHAGIVPWILLEGPGRVRVDEGVPAADLRRALAALRASHGTLR